MYDKYLRGNTFLTGPTGLPKHKGFLFSHSASAGLSAGFYIINDEGNTFFMGLTFASGINILPMQIHTLRPHPTGLTALYLN